MPTATVNGLEMYYEVHGQGEPLVMIMGLGATLDWWDEVIVRRLSRRYRLLLFDNRGAGRTAMPGGDYTIQLLAEDTAALMSHAGMEQAHVLGASMGGMIAQELALSHPDRVDKLILVCTSCGGPEAVPPSPEVIQLILDQSGTPEERRARQARLLFPEDYINHNKERLVELAERISRYPTSPETFQLQLGAILTFSSYSRLPQIQMPTLVMTGNQDVLIPPQNSEILARRIPNARLVVFPGGGHGFTSQFPEQFCQEVEKFLLGAG